MPAVDRNNPKRSTASESSYSLMEFMREFPDDRACLEHLWRERFAADGHTAHCPKCDRPRKFHRVKSRPSYSCDHCGHHLHPTAGTIFHKSATSLHLWFYAMYLMTSTRCGISAKQLERELGVTYKTAWRMANLIRNKLMEQDDEPLSGEVEADETFFGGKPRAADLRKARAVARQPGLRPGPGVRPSQMGGLARRDKAAVFGAVQRGGQVRATVIPDSRAVTLGHNLKRFVLAEARLITDEWKGYTEPGKAFRQHDTIRHKEHVYVSGDVHTNTIEGFFGNVKRGISGNYHNVSRKWLQGYLNEYVWRYNHRADRRAMFLTLLDRSADERPAG